MLRQLLPTALVAAVLGVCLACSVRNAATGTIALAQMVRPGPTVEDIRNSFILAAAAAFSVSVENSNTLRAEPVGSALPPTFATSLSTLLTAVTSATASRTTELSSYFGYSMKDVGNVSVTLDPSATTVSVEANGRITFGVPVLSAALAASVERVYRSENDQLTVTQIAEQFRESTDALRAVANSNGTTRSDRAQLVDVAYSELPYSSALEDVHSGMLAFVLAHEVGHLALGHLETTECSADQETNADRFATLLLSDFFMSKSITTLGTNQESLDSLIQAVRRHNPVFIGLTYDELTGGRMPRIVYVHSTVLKEYAGYATFLGRGLELLSASREDACHPPPAARVTAASEAFDYAVVHYSERAVKRWAAATTLKRLFSDFVSGQ